MIPSPSAFDHRDRRARTIDPAPAGRIVPMATCDLPCAGTQSNAAERLREGLSENVSNMYTMQCKM
jgi:hypothetical protein